jgi:D-alanyl-D-alanine carboxypeptidase
MFKITVFSSLLLLSVTLYGQNHEVSLSGAPYNHEHSEIISDLSKSFVFELPEQESTPEPEEAWKSWSMVENFTYGKDRGNLPMIADLDALHPYFRDKIITLISMCKAKGIELAIVESYRTHSKQNEYKSMGKKYTRSGGGKSRHQYGLAIDVVPVIDSVAQWEDTKLWRKVGVIGEQLGLRWGGRWRELYDPGHFEWTGGLTSYHLSMGQWPRIAKANNYPCLDEEIIQLTEYWKAWEAEQSAITRQQTSSSKMN